MRPSLGPPSERVVSRCAPARAPSARRSPDGDARPSGLPLQAGHEFRVGDRRRLPSKRTQPPFPLPQPLCRHKRQRRPNAAFFGRSARPPASGSHRFAALNPPWSRRRAGHTLAECVGMREPQPLGLTTLPAEAEGGLTRFRHGHITGLRYSVLHRPLPISRDAAQS